MPTIPKRTDERLGHRSAAENSVDRAPTGECLTIPPPADNWHPIARDWYLALRESGQCRFYESSDWATAYLVAESMSRDLKPKFVGVDTDNKPMVRTMPLSGSSMTAYLRAMSVLLVTEGDRRKASLELQRGPAVDADADAAATQMSAYRAAVA